MCQRRQMPAGPEKGFGRQHWQRHRGITINNDRATSSIPGEIDEVNPCVRRTGWIPFLTGCPQGDLLIIVQKPDDNALTRDEAIAAVIWQFISNVTAASEGAVHNSEVMLRFEARELARYRRRCRYISLERTD